MAKRLGYHRFIERRVISKCKRSDAPAGSPKKSERNFFHVLTTLTGVLIPDARPGPANGKGLWIALSILCPIPGYSSSPGINFGMEWYETTQITHIYFTFSPAPCSLIYSLQAPCFNSAQEIIKRSTFRAGKHPGTAARQQFSPLLRFCMRHAAYNEFVKKRKLWIPKWPQHRKKNILFQRPPAE